MPFFEWLLTQRQHPDIGAFARWAWSEQSPIPRSTRRLYKVLEHLEAPPYRCWRSVCKYAHRQYRREMKDQAAA